jgi:murein DD-endopeptidase
MKKIRNLKFSLLLSFILLTTFISNAQNYLGAPFDINCEKSPSPVKIDNKIHLLYELHLTNSDIKPWTILGLTISNGTTNSPLIKYSKEDLSSMVGLIGTVPDSVKVPNVVKAGTLAIIYLDIPMPAEKPLPKTLKHSFSFSETSDTTTKGVVLVDAPILNINLREPLVLNPPLQGKYWVAVNGPSNFSIHRRVWVVTNGKGQIPQRFAIDWNKIGNDGHPYHGDPTKNSSWASYGNNVLAVAPAIVVKIKDQIPENIPFQNPAVPITEETVAGNYIILKLDDGSFALYAHLQPGSLKVRVGDRVKTGQVLALLGNSGNSELPHLHFQLMDKDSPLGSEGLPYTIKSFEFLGIANIPELLDPEKTWRPSSKAIVHNMEIPAENFIINFNGK